MDISLLIHSSYIQINHQLKAELTDCHKRIKFEEWLRDNLQPSSDFSWFNRAITYLYKYINADKKEPINLLQKEDDLLAKIVKKAAFLSKPSTEDEESLPTNEFDVNKLFSALKNTSLPKTSLVLTENLLKNGISPLNILRQAITQGNITILQSIQQLAPNEFKSAIIFPDADGNTSLHFALMSTNPEVMEFLASVSSKDFMAALIMKNYAGKTPSVAHLFSSRNLNLKFINYFFNELGFVPPLGLFSNLDNEINQHAKLNILLQDWVNSIVPHFVPPPKRTFLEIPLLLGNMESFLYLANRLTKKERNEGFNTIKDIYGDGVLPYIENALWEIDSNHYSLGAKMEEILPSPSPLSMEENFLKLENEIKVLEIKEDISTMISGVINKIKNKTPLVGHENWSQEKILEWYDQKCRYLFHALNSYNIGEVEGDPNNKKYFINTIADIAPWCKERWDNELSQLYQNGLQLRAAALKEEDLSELIPSQSELTVVDKLQGKARELRRGIVRRSLPEIDQTNHEPNYFEDLLGATLGLQSDLHNDSNAQFYSDPLTFPNHSYSMALSRFNKLYTPHFVISEMVNHLQHSLVAPASQNPYDLNPRDFSNFIVDSKAESWKKRKYDTSSVLNRLEEMQARKADTIEVKEYLDDLGIDWSGEMTLNEKIVYLEKKLEAKKDSIEKHKRMLMSIQKKNTSTSTSTDPIGAAQQKLIRDIHAKELYLNKLAQLLHDVYHAKTDKEKAKLLEKSDVISKVTLPKVTEGEIKLAQKMDFTKNFVFDEEGKFKRRAVIESLEMAHLIKRRAS